MQKGVENELISNFYTPPNDRKYVLEEYIVYFRQTEYFYFAVGFDKFIRDVVESAIDNADVKNASTRSSLIVYVDKKSGDSGQTVINMISVSTN